MLPPEPCTPPQANLSYGKGPPTLLKPRKSWPSALGNSNDAAPAVPRSRAAGSRRWNAKEMLRLPHPSSAP